jgi:hypothetical protein
LEVTNSAVAEFDIAIIPVQLYDVAIRVVENVYNQLPLHNAREILGIAQCVSVSVQQQQGPFSTEGAEHRVSLCFSFLARLQPYPNVHHLTP